MPPLYLLHPATVHFPIALLSLGLVVEWWYLIRRTPLWLGEAASWLLWLGAASAWVAMSLGLIAEDRAPHVPAAWQTLAEHKELGIWTVGLFTFLALWRLGPVFYAKPSFLNEPKAKWAFGLLWTIAVGVLLATAYHGGEVVFTYGMGVAQ